MAENRYEAQRVQLLAEFDGVVGRVHHLFLARFGAEQTDAMVSETRREYESLLGQLPDVGGQQPFTRFVIATGWFLAMYRALQAHGHSVEEAGQLIYDVTRVYLQAVPGFASSLLGFMTFTPLYKARLKKRARASHQRRLPGDYVYNYVDGDGRAFDYGVDYVECASLKFLQAQGAPELAPYLCAADHIYSELMGWGLKRTQTLAEGAGCCDFRFKRGGKTDVALPPGLSVA